MKNNTLRRIRFWFVQTLLKRRRLEDLDDELAFHLEQCEAAYRAQGLSPAEAHRRAFIDFGGVERTREDSNRQRPLWWLETLLQDLRYALRGFRRNRSFALTILLTLAIGLGATTAVFTVVDRILFRPLPYADDGRIVSLGLSQPLEKQEFTLGFFFYDWRASQKPFTNITFERGVDECNLTDSNPLRLHCAYVSGDFLPTLGIPLELGRNFLPEEDQPHGAEVALISDALWLSRFNRDPGVLGKTIALDEKPVRIVGVLPRDFEMPRLQPADIVRPAQMDIAAQHTVNAGLGLPMWAFARLKPGVSLAEARAQMAPIYAETRKAIPPQIRDQFVLALRPLRQRQMQEATKAAWILLAGVLAVLLMACANVAGLFSARGAARSREMALRSVLGASRGRLMRQTLTEALLLALASAVAGCLLALLLLRVFVAIAPAGMPFLSQARLDLRVLFFAVAAALVSAAFFGVLPVMERPGADILTARAGSTRIRPRFRQFLVGLQMAIGILLLSGSLLLVRSFWNLERQSLGLETRNVLVVRTPLTGSRYPNAQAYMDFYLRAEASLRALPGIGHVAITESLPPDANAWHSDLRYGQLMAGEHPATPSGGGSTVVRRAVTPAYFQVLGIPLLEGRGFNEQERSLRNDPIVLSRLLAARLFPAGDSIGQHIRIAQFNPNMVLGGPVYTVVGVAANVRNAGLTGEDDPEFYTLRASGQPEQWSSHSILLLQSALPATVLAPLIRARIAQLDPTAPVEIEPLRSTVDRLADGPRFETALMAFFALCGVVMAIAGLYGLVSYLVAQRTQEIGVRMALGATRTDALRLIAAEGMRLALFGGLAGLAAALAAAHLLRSLLFDVAPYDPLFYAGAAALLGAVALVATLIPARRASRIEPMAALRHE